MEDFAMMMEREAGSPETVPALAVGFALHPIEDIDASEKAGHPVFRDVEFVKIMVPGDKQSKILQPATDKHRQRFPRAYAAFKEQSATPDQGMPLEMWPQITRGQAMTFRAMHIQTVEALAAVHDGNLAALGFNGRELREKARAFLAVAKDTAASQKQAAEMAELKEVIALQQQQIADLAARLGEGGPSATAVEAKPAPKPRKTT